MSRTLRGGICARLLRSGRQTVITCNIYVRYVMKSVSICTKEMVPKPMNEFTDNGPEYARLA
jgi:hypothetical protein